MTKVIFLHKQNNYSVKIEANTHFGGFIR